MITGTIYNAGKMLEMTQKWEQKKSSGNILKKEVKELLKQGIEIVREQYHLDADEEVALKQIDAMKTELVNIYKFKQSNGNVRYDLAPDKVGKLNDDRAYVMAMAAWVLQGLRRESLIKRKPAEDLEQFFDIRRPKATHSYFNR